MREGRGIDPLRLAESAGQAALVLAAVVLPAAWRTLDGSLVAVLAGMQVLLTAAVYALHAVTFDYFRLTTDRRKPGFSYTQRED